MRRYTGFMGIFMRIYRAWSRRCPRRGYTGPIPRPTAWIGPSCSPAPNLCRATNSSVFHAAFLLTLRATRRHGHRRPTCVHIGEVAWFPSTLCCYEAIPRGLEGFSAFLINRRGRLIILDHGLVTGRVLNNADPKDGVTCFERFMGVKGRAKKDFVLCVVFNVDVCQRNSIGIEGLRSEGMF